MAERPSKAGGGMEPVGMAGPSWAWGWRGDALLHGEGIRSGLLGWLGRSKLDGMGVCCRVARAPQAPGRPLCLEDFLVSRTGLEDLGWPVPLMLSPLLQRVLITQRRGCSSSQRGFPPPRL